MYEKLTYQELEQEIELLRKQLNLQDSGEKFDNFFENNKVIMLQLNSTSKKIVKVNNSAVRFYGYTKEDLLQKTINDLNILPNNEIDKLMKKAILKKSIFFQFKHRLADNSIRDVEIYASPLISSGIVYLIAMIYDITNRLNAEKMVQKLSMAVEQSSNMIVITDINGNIEYTNPKFTELTGYTAEEAIGNNPRILNSGIQPKAYYKGMWKAISSGKTWKGEFYNKTKAGNFFWEQVTITPIKDKNDKIINFLAIKEDITARKAAKEALLKSEKKYSTFLENLDDIAFETDRNGIITYLNKKAEKVMNVPLSEMLGKSFLPLLDDGSKQKAIDISTEILKGKNLEYELTLRNNRVFRFKSAPKRDENGEIIGISGIAREITRRIKADHEIQEQNKMLKELNATKDKFFSIIAHDLKSPFNTLLGFSELLMENIDNYDTGKQKQLIALIQKGAENTYKLLENLLLWSRAQSGRLEYKPTKINLNQAINGTLNLLDQPSKSKSITLINQVPDTIFVKADLNMLSTILRNLSSNAIKFTPRNGEIILKTAHINKQNLIEITVQDNGIGISKENQAKLFLISENVSTKGTEDETGTGLGLILCKEFVERQGGKISVESQIGTGSKFTFSLPVMQSDPKKF